DHSADYKLVLDHSPDCNLDSDRDQGAIIRRMRRPPSKLVQRLVSASEEVLRPDPALRLEDIATLIGSARATLYYHFSGRDDLVAFLLEENLRAAAETIELAITTTQPPPVVQL